VLYFGGSILGERSGVLAGGGAARCRAVPGPGTPYPLEEPPLRQRGDACPPAARGGNPMASLSDSADRSKVIDLLNERLAFERAGVKLYDRVLEVLRASGDANEQQMLDEMQQHRDEEKEHEEWLEEQIRNLGGDAHSETEHSRLITRESKGIEEVVMSEAQLPHLFHALLAAELVDNAGWDLLAQLAGDAGDHGAKREFKKRLHEEEDHLLFVRKAVERYSQKEVLGKDVVMPSSSGLFSSLT
jgi:bacterioferritin (cytochrome b1)